MISGPRHDACSVRLATSLACTEALENPALQTCVSTHHVTGWHSALPTRLQHPAMASELVPVPCLAFR